MRRFIVKNQLPEYAEIRSNFKTNPPISPRQWFIGLCNSCAGNCRDWCADHPIIARAGARFETVFKPQTPTDTLNISA
jgi:hypothetical protein